LQDPPKFTQIGILGLKICHLANLLRYLFTLLFDLMPDFTLPSQQRMLEKGSKIPFVWFSSVSLVNDTCSHFVNCALVRKKNKNKTKIVLLQKSANVPRRRRLSMPRTEWLKNQPNQILVFKVNSEGAWLCCRTVLLGKKLLF
jgi:hypothetical protein